MELKDVILSTLAEMENDTVQQYDEPINNTDTQTIHTEESSLSNKEQNKAENAENELNYLKSIRERLLVLFEGFQSPNNTNIEAKIDMTLNFLEYMLATIDERVEKLEKEESL